MKTGLYDLVRGLLRGVYAVFLPGRTYGLENLPEEGGYVLCVNHIHARDPFFVAVRVGRRLSFLAKKELFVNKLVGGFIAAVGGISVDRGKADLSAMRASIAVVKGGGALGIFPQGTRSRDNSRTPMLTGASMIALRCGAPVLPAFIDGPYRLFRRTDVYFGAPIDFSSIGTRIDANALQAATDLIDGAVWSLKGDTQKLLNGGK